MPYTTIDKAPDHFNTKLYTGTGSAASITGVGFQPDWVWAKDRTSANSHQLSDAVRGVTKTLFSDATAAEVTDAQRLTAFGTDGFSVGTNSSWNTNSNNYVSWNWKAGGAGSTNTDGNMNSTVTTSANTTAGFSIITWTGSGNTNYNTIGHGLGAVPKFVIIKNRTDVCDWMVYHHVLGNASFFHLNTTDNEQAGTGIFNSTTPTSSVITLGSDNKSNGTNDSMVAYAFAEKAGFSRFGVYSGNNNSDGSFVYTGFKPAWILMKRNSSGASWSLVDTKRPGYNETNVYLLPDTTAADQSTAVDILSHGFKLRTSAGNQNASSTYYFAAFAEAPIVGSNNIPALAR